MSSVTSTHNQKNLVFYFQVHQPRRLRTLRFFDIGANRSYFDEQLNREIIQRVARNCYQPTNALLLKLIKKYPHIRIAFSISGVTLDQFEEHTPEVLKSFKRLAETGSVDFLTETYYHSLSCLIPGNEFEMQVAKHQKKILTHFGILSNVFRNTELIYSDQVGQRISQLGFKGVIIDGIERILNYQHPHQVFESSQVPNLKMLLRNYRLSDDISFRFSQNSSTLSVEQYMSWLNAVPAHENVINLAMDYETFGEHQKKESGIFSFVENLFIQLARSKKFRFLTPSQAVETLEATQKLNLPGFISWADEERDLSAWLGNEMQRDAFDSMVKLEADVKGLLDKALLRQWRTLQTSDHFYYMSTKKGSDGDVHNYFSPYASPYEAFINYMNVLTDFSLRLKIRKATGIFSRKTEDVAVSKDLLEVPA
jgi:alpha-amylase